MKTPYISITILSLLLSALGQPPPPAPGPVAAVQPRQDPNPVNLLLALVLQLFPISVLVQDMGGLVMDAETTFAEIAGFATTENDLLDFSSCADVVVVFARGTSEPGNVGSLVGPPFFAELRRRLSARGMSLAVQGVDDYAADVEGFLEGGEAKGSQRM